MRSFPRFWQVDDTWCASDDALGAWTCVGSSLDEVVLLHREALLVFPLDAKINHYEAKLAITATRLKNALDALRAVDRYNFANHGVPCADPDKCDEPDFCGMWAKVRSAIAENRP